MVLIVGHPFTNIKTDVSIMIPNYRMCLSSRLSYINVMIKYTRNIGAEVRHQRFQRSLLSPSSWLRSVCKSGKVRNQTLKTMFIEVCIG